MTDETPEFVLDEVPVPAGSVAVRHGTVSIEILPEQAIAAGQQHERAARLAAANDPGIPPLPAEPKPSSRHGRRWVDPATAPAEFEYEPYLRPRPGRRPAPEGFWREYVYGVTLGLLNLGDSRPVRARKALDARIARPVGDTALFVPVLSSQGGVGATTVTTLLGMALAEGRDDHVLAIDAHPSRGLLADRIADPDAVAAGVRDVAGQVYRIRNRDELESRMTRDRTGLHVLASSADPLHDGVLRDREYTAVADLAGRFYSIVLTDGGSGVLEPVTQAALRRAGGIVLVSGGTAEQARLASETVSWLEQHDLAHLAAGAVVALNTSTPGTRYESLDAIEAHFRARVRGVVRIPYDEELVAGAPVRYGALRPDTRDAARDLAALLLDGLDDGDLSADVQ
ncbi:MAG TPA: MinD/ParA family protein [Pseudolysinimonas sp.]|nr:MinD/ParA family protein [Pseudolysinimonas sp.]